MKVQHVATQLNIPAEAVEEAQSSLGMRPGQEVGVAELDRLRAQLESDHRVDPSAFERLRTSITTSSAPRPPEPQDRDRSASVGRLDLSAFGALGRNIAARGERLDLILERKTRNCGDTAGLVLDGLRSRAETKTERDLPMNKVLDMLAKPASEHQVWDITVHQHTFTLERSPDGSNVLIQSYQPGYNVQHWCGLEEPYLDNQALADLPKEWFRPSDAKVALLGATIRELYDGEPSSQVETWKNLPFNPQDPLVLSERMETLAFTANLVHFEQPAEKGVSLAGLKDAIAELSG